MPSKYICSLEKSDEVNNGIAFVLFDSSFFFLDEHNAEQRNGTWKWNSSLINTAAQAKAYKMLDNSNETKNHIQNISNAVFNWKAAVIAG